MKILITGGAGFIGSAVVRQYINETDFTVINIDKLTYAGNISSLGEVFYNPRHIFRKIDICDRRALEGIYSEFDPDAVIHLAAESHVDRSIDGPSEFIQTNIIGTYTLLEASRAFWSELTDNKREQFRFLHVSTDEVYGSLGKDGYFNEQSPYKPNSPYSASKAASDHLVRAWNRTFGLPVITTNCSNNYGPYQFPEKLIPLMILNAQRGRPLPVYGKGDNIRDWLFVEDHARALRLLLEKGSIGDNYNIGGRNERSNIDVVKNICTLLDELLPNSPYRNHSSLITFVNDRPGHDQRYAIDSSKIMNEFGWKPFETFESGLRKTIEWYIGNSEWVQNVTSGSYRERERRQYD